MEASFFLHNIFLILAYTVVSIQCRIIPKKIDKLFTHKERMFLYNIQMEFAFFRKPFTQNASENRHALKKRGSSEYKQKLILSITGLKDESEFVEDL